MRFIIEPYNFEIHLIYDPGGDFDEKIVIPITYNTVDNFCCIEDKKYREMYNCDDYGIDNIEIELINKIMNYIMNHKDEIDEMCSSLYWEERIKKEGL